MKSSIKRFGLSLGLAGALVGLGAGGGAVPAMADGQGATTIPCSDLQIPGAENLQGTVVINNNGVIINCFEHTQGDITPPIDSAQVIDCSEALGFPAKGIAVVTPTGSILINCHPHFISTGPPA